MERYDITIVVITFNRARMLEKALETLVTQVTNGEFTYEIIVVDDGSTDDTSHVVNKIVNAQSCNIIYIKQEGQGVAQARNGGVQEAQGNWIAFFDDDQLAEVDWLINLYRVAHETGAECIGGSIDLALPEAMGSELGPRCRNILGENIKNKLRDGSLKNNLATGNMLIKKSLFAKVGWFDISFKKGGSDSDLIWRIQREGFKIAFAPGALVHHVIPEYRLRLTFLKWVCFKLGFATARIHFKYKGRSQLITLSFLAFGVAILRDAFLLLLGTISNNNKLVWDSKCGYWYNKAFIQGSLFYLMPKLFPQEDIINSLDFRYHGGDRNITNDA